MLDDFTAKRALRHLFTYKMRSENLYKARGYKLSNIRLDRAGDNINNAVKEFSMHNGVQLESSPPYASQSNCAAERLVQEHWTRVRVLLFFANLPMFVWPEAIVRGNWLRNRGPSSRKGGLHTNKALGPQFEDRVLQVSLICSFILRSDTISVKNLLPRSIYGHFVVMISGTVLLNVCIHIASH